LRKSDNSKYYINSRKVNFTLKKIDIKFNNSVQINHSSEMN